ncbi:O-antigen ligase family protein [Rossellomorea vietnamensis]|uniref:O-antigen ligase family protein n=1 Tax=Rossellomorea vietnamensis TaxID=218284 RepID=UPI003CFB7A70
MESMINKLAVNKVVQIIAAIVIGVFIAVAVNRISSGVLTIDKTLIAVGALLVITAMSAFLIKIKRLQLEYIFLYLFVATSFLNAGMFSIEIGPFGLFPYRVFFVLSFAVFCWKMVKGHIRIYNSRVKPILYFFYFWLCYAALSLIWAASIMEGIKYLVLLFIGIVLITLVNVYFKGRLQYLNLFYIWTGMTVVLILIGLWNHLTKQHLAVSAINALPERVQGIPTAVFVNQNDYAAYLAISIFFFVAFYKYSTHHVIKLANLGFIFLTLYLIYLTESRASMLGLGIGAFIYIFLLSKPWVKKIFLIAGSVIASIGIIMFGDRLMTKVSETIGGPINPSQMGSNDIRVNLTRNAMDFISNSYGLGVGAGNAQFYLENYARYFTRGIYKMHNWWLEIFSNFGLFIFVGYVMVFAILIVNFYKFLKKSTDKTERMITEALLFSLITFIPASISPSSISNLFFHWSLLAISIGFLNYIRSKRSYDARVY